MARQKTDKKLISFVKLPLIERLVKDEAEFENRSESAIIEAHLLDSFMSQNKNAKFWVENYLYSEDGGIGQTLEAIFSVNSAGIRWQSKYDNFLPLVEFARTQQAFCRTILSGKEKEIEHCCSQLESVVERLKNLSQDENVPVKKYNYEKEAKWADELLKELKEEPCFSRLINIYTVLLNNWEDLKGWSITYRLLTDLVKLEKGWRNTPETRIELLRMIRKVTGEWET